jgi:ribosomal protein S11
MKHTCKSQDFILTDINPIDLGNIITITSSKNNTRISVRVKGRLIGYTSSGRSSVYTGYEKRLGIAAYTNAKAFIQSLGPQVKKIKFSVKVRGFNKQAMLGLLDSGIKIVKVQEVLNPAFNGCRKKKSRRL